MRRRGLLTVCIAALLMTAMGAGVMAAEESIVVASTTSTQDSGLFGHLLPLVRERTGVQAKVVAQGTGQALETARRGDADVVFVHDAAAEAKFVEEGFGLARREVMYNDFILVGPAADPAKVRGGKDIASALQAIRRRKALFISRGDKSGTHQAELRLWQVAGIEPAAAGESWYRSVGQGMGPSLNMASASEAYILTDRATWVNFRNKGSLVVLVEGDARLFNQYSLILVNPARHPSVKVAPAQRFIDFLLSAEGQAAIANYKVEGQQLFYPNAAPAARR